MRRFERMRPPDGAPGERAPRITPRALRSSERPWDDGSLPSSPGFGSLGFAATPDGWERLGLGLWSGLGLGLGLGLANPYPNLNPNQVGAEGGAPQPRVIC